MAYKKLIAADEFVDRLLEIAKNNDQNKYKTLYVLGGWGARATTANKTYYAGKNSFNASRKGMIMGADPDTWFFDCVCLIKAIFWGWTGDPGKPYGGAVYASNGVPDINEATMYKQYCYDLSTDWGKIEKGEVVWLKGHIGVYIGKYNGVHQVVECSPAFMNCVQITALGNAGPAPGYNVRSWTGHAKLPWIEYASEKPKVEKIVPKKNGVVDGKLYDDDRVIIAQGEHLIAGAWYFVDEDGTPAISKDVYIPYVYKDEEPGSTDGKWVRYDADGKMVKGWNKDERGIYYFDQATGAMAKGDLVINSIRFKFEEKTGILDNVSFREGEQAK